MTENKPTKTIEFSERDEDFIKLLAKNIGCHYSKANTRTYNLNKYKTGVPSETGIFAWVHKEGDDQFWVTTRKIWVEKAKAKMLAGRKKTGANCFPRDNQHAEDSVHFNTKVDYLKTVKVLSLINKNQ